MTTFTKENPPKHDDYSPEALKFREEAATAADNANGQGEDDKAAKVEEKQAVGVDGHPPHAVFSESEHPRVAEGEPNLEPAPTDFDALK